MPSRMERSWTRAILPARCHGRTTRYRVSVRHLRATTRLESLKVEALQFRDSVASEIIPARALGAVQLKAYDQ